jgi:hypothetical protein
MDRFRCAVFATAVLAVSFVPFADEPKQEDRRPADAGTRSKSTAPNGRGGQTRPELSRPSTARRTLGVSHGVTEDPVAPPQPKALPTPPPSGWGVVSEGAGGGGVFRDTDSAAETWLGSDGFGVRGAGSYTGGYFVDSDGAGEAFIGHGQIGIDAYGSAMAGLFENYSAQGAAYLGKADIGIDAFGSNYAGAFWNSPGVSYAIVGGTDSGIDALGNIVGGRFNCYGSTGTAELAWGNIGISASGSNTGGIFADTDNTGYAKVAVGNRGIEATGSGMGGYFGDSAASGYAHVGVGNRGIESFGSEMGGYFKDTYASGFAHLGWEDTGVFGRGNVAGGVFNDGDDSGYARAGWGDRGVDAGGHEMGGHFKDSDSSGYSYVGNGDQGILSAGNYVGGIFHDIDHSGYSYVGFGDRGIEAFGNDMGGYFEESDGTGIANLAVGNRGIQAFGTNVGGYFEDTNSSAWSSAAYDTTKITGTGSVNFVQNHPYDPASVVVYTAPEGDEVATYTRGTGRVSGGEARVPLGETFRWVTNPDIGLTAYAMPIGNWCDLYVAEKGTEEIVVRTRDGSECVFDYLVYGLRIGFEESTVVQEKTREAYIPSMKSHRDRVASHPELARHTALARWTGVRMKALGEAENVDLSRAHELRDLIQEYDPAVHGPLGPRRSEARKPLVETSKDTAPKDPGDAPGESLAIRSSGERRAAGQLARMPAADAGRDVYARSFRPSSPEVASLVEVSESVEAGDVLVIDRGSAGMMRRGFEGHDSGVIGVATENAGVVLGSQSPGLFDDEAGRETTLRAEVAMAGVVSCKVDAAFGAIWPGDLLVTSPTPGHAMRTDSPLPGTIVGKALEPLEEGTGLIRVLVMLR